MSNLKIKIDIFPAHRGGQRVEKQEKWGFVRKDDSGKERRYLAGISSGTDVDGHGERMSPRCVAGFHEQATAKDILLFVNHDRNWSEDIGILVASQILDNGDWYTEYRLYDITDNVGERSIEEAEKAWARANGLPPYKHPVTFGFSIEGFVEDNNMVGTTIDYVDLDPGVALVSRPAYHRSIASALQKALSGRSQHTGFDKSFQKALASQETFSTRLALETALDQAIDEAKAINDPAQKQDVISKIYKQYSQKMTALESGSEETPMRTVKGIDQLPPDLQTQLLDVISDLKMVTDAVAGGSAGGEVPNPQQAQPPQQKPPQEASMATQGKEITPPEQGRAPTADSAAGYVDPAKDQQQSRGDQREQKADDEMVALKALAALSPQRRKALMQILRDDAEQVVEDDDDAIAGQNISRDVPDNSGDEGAGALNSGKKGKPAEDLIGGDNESQMGVHGDDADEVVKNLLQTVGLRKSAPARKTVQVTRTEKVQRDTARVIASIADRLNTIEKALGNLFEGFGVGEAISHVQKSENRQGNEWWGGQSQHSGQAPVQKGLGAHLGNGHDTNKAFADMIAESIIAKSGAGAAINGDAGQDITKKGLRDGNVLNFVLRAGQRV